MTMRSRDLSSIGGETDQNLPDDNMFEQEAGEEGAEQTGNEEDNAGNEESDEESGTENEAEEEKSTCPPPVKVSHYQPYSYH